MSKDQSYIESSKPEIGVVRRAADQASLLVPSLLFFSQPSPPLPYSPYSFHSCHFHLHLLFCFFLILYIYLPLFHLFYLPVPFSTPILFLYLPCHPVPSISLSVLPSLIHFLFPSSTSILLSSSSPFHPSSFHFLPNPPQLSSTPYSFLLSSSMV